jgi:hypothetical protein
LTTTYNIATAQIDLVTKKSVGDSIMQYMTSYYNYIKFARASGGLPSSPKPATLKTIKSDQITFASNGVLRAHVAKAESCLQIAILQLLQENVMSYVKCGINIRRGMLSTSVVTPSFSLLFTVSKKKKKKKKKKLAYASYSLVWQEYKRMGQLHHDYIDEDTLSGIQFGYDSFLIHGFFFSHQ